MNYLKDLFKNFIGPALFAAACVYGWYSYQMIQVQKAAIDQMAQVLSGQCKIMLEQQGFSVTEVPNAEDENVGK
jgi:hypothetical protein